MKRYLANTILIWAILNLLLNMIGFGINLFASEYYNAFEWDQFLWSLRDIGIQIISFAVVTMLASLLIKSRKWSLYVFALFQLIMFHFIFFLDLQWEETGLQFFAYFSSWEFEYLELNQQNLVEIMSLVYPMYGMFDHGMFVPELFRFYFGWIILTAGYYFMVTWLTDKLEFFYSKWNRLIPQQGI